MERISVKAQAEITFLRLACRIHVYAKFGNQYEILDDRFTKLILPIPLGMTTRDA